MKCSVDSTADVSGTTVCATALVVHWNYRYTFVQEGADLKVCDVNGAAFVMFHLFPFNTTVSTVRLMKDGSDVHILNF